MTIPVTSCSFTFLSVNFKYSDTGHADVYSNLVVLNLVNHFFSYSRKKYVLFFLFFFTHPPVVRRFVCRQLQLATRYLKPGERGGADLVKRCIIHSTRWP